MALPVWIFQFWQPPKNPLEGFAETLDFKEIFFAAFDLLEIRVQIKKTQTKDLNSVLD